MRRINAPKTLLGFFATMALALVASCGGEIEGHDPQGNITDPTLQTTSSANRRFYLHYDHQGTPIASTNSQGTRSCHQEFRPYGGMQLSGGTCPQLKYTGMVFDEDTGLYYYNARYYDPKIGRFISVDSVRGTIGQPQSHNRYAYVLNNPYRYVDPTGHEPEQCAAYDGMRPRRGEHRAVGAVEGAWVDLKSSAAGMSRVDWFMAGASLFGGGAGRVVKATQETVSQFSFAQLRRIMQTARSPYKGSTLIAQRYSKHLNKGAGRRPEIWGKLRGNMDQWNEDALGHLRDIMRGPGKFARSAPDARGRQWLEKTLPDGRGVRLNLDHSFKGFIDQKR